MKWSQVYPVVFTIALCGLCASVLTFAHEEWRERIAANEQFQKVRAVVSALGLAGDDRDRRSVRQAYQRHVKENPRGQMLIYEGCRDGEVVGYAFEIEGQGRYGPIKGILAVDPTETRILALRIYRQEETPGLGGRIARREWQRQFEGMRLEVRGSPGILVSATHTGPNVIPPITGASKTTYSVARMINRGIAGFLAGGQPLEELDLGLGDDAVTRATPPYPKHRPKPPNLREEVQRPPFMAPPGLENLALGKPVKSSMDYPPIIGELEQVTDGVKKSKEFQYVELDHGPQWVQIDLQRRCTIFAVVVWHFYKEPVIYRDVIVQVADDEKFTRNVRTLFNNDHDNSSGLGAGKDTSYHARWWGEIVDARGPAREGTDARFVRVWTNGGTADEDTRFVEIAVYGR